MASSLVGRDNTVVAPVSDSVVANEMTSPAPPLDSHHEQDNMGRSCISIRKINDCK